MRMREDPAGPSCVQALDLRAPIHVPGLGAGSDVVIGALLVDADSPFLHGQECVHRIHRCCQEAKYLRETGMDSPQTHQQSTRCPGRTLSVLQLCSQHLARLNV